MVNTLSYVKLLRKRTIAEVSCDFRMAVIGTEDSEKKERE